VGSSASSRSIAHQPDSSDKKRRPLFMFNQTYAREQRCARRRLARVSSPRKTLYPTTRRTSHTRLANPSSATAASDTSGSGFCRQTRHAARCAQVSGGLDPADGGRTRLSIRSTDCVLAQIRPIGVRWFLRGNEFITGSEGDNRGNKGVRRLRLRMWIGALEGGGQRADQTVVTAAVTSRVTGWTGPPAGRGADRRRRFPRG
jgi:hypothetical protein